MISGLRFRDWGVRVYEFGFAGLRVPGLCCKVSGLCRVRESGPGADAPNLEPSQGVCNSRGFG